MIGIDNTAVQRLANLNLEEQREKLSILNSEEKLELVMSIPNNRKTFNIGDSLINLHRMTNLIFIIERAKLLKHFLIFFSFFILISLSFKQSIVRPNTCYRIDDYYDGDETNSTCFEQSI